jgi:hypothetical protein
LENLPKYQAMVSAISQQPLFGAFTMSEPTGTANILHQFTAYNQLREDYSSEVANTLTQTNLARHNVPATPAEVEAWHRINTAAVNAKLDIPAERSIAEALANAAVANILGTVSTPSTTEEPETTNTADENPYKVQFADDEDEDEHEDELPSLEDIYGYEDDEDNQEAALDDLLKAQERVD